ILESDVIWYHNHLRSYRNRFMIEAGAQNPAARTLETPEAEIGEMIRMVIAHEVGHAIGLPHNMKASSAYPTDSLRVASFTQKYGLTPSIMDYARVNSVAQPEDQGVRYIRMMGPYDYYAVNWGYRYIPEAKTAEEEKPMLDQWILEKAGNPWYEFGSSTGVDPHSQTESLGDDNIKASLYGLANMKKVIPNLIDWTTKDGYGYDDLDEVYGELTRLWRGYVYHVITNVGGIYETRKTADQDGVVYEPVPEAIQKEAVTFLNEHAFITPEWLLDKEILNRIESDGAIERIQNLQTRALNSLLSVDRINRLVSTVEQEGADAYSPIELMTDLRKGIFSELYAAQKTDAYRRNLQRAFIDIASEYIKKEKADDDEVLKSDASALMRGVLNQMRRDLNTRKNYSGDTITQYHFEDLIARIDTAFDRD
ncbi:MAG: zinc-dependent metalloprotease, partial [Bacteroidota bacterium]|nr:zinc-dependent metalloprotease [Bacteroidota bacterium]